MKIFQISASNSKQVLLILLFAMISITVSAQTCTSLKDYETGLKNGLKTAPPCELVNANKLPKCAGEYSPTTWSTCYGERTTANGSTYRGWYFEGKANGKGEFVNPDGTRYLGEYAKGQRNGYGKEYAANGTVHKEGQWTNGVFASVTQEAQDVRLLLSTTNAENTNRSLAQCSGQWAYLTGSIRSGTIKFPNTEAAIKGYAMLAANALAMANKISGFNSEKIAEDFYNNLVSKHRSFGKEHGKTELATKLAYELAMNGSEKCADYIGNKDVIAVIRNQ